jgi:hypothetical protein
MALPRSGRYKIILFGNTEKGIFGGVSEGLPQPYGNGFRYVDVSKGGKECVVSGNIAIIEDPSKPEEKKA